MRSYRILTLGLAAAVLAACAQSGPPAVDVAAEAQAIRDRSAEWLKQAQARNADGVMTVYAADAATLFDGNIRKGAAEIRAGLDAEMAAMPDAVLSWTTDEVKVAASGDLAYERGSFTLDSDGAGEKPADNGEFVTIWSKGEGGWQVVVDAGTVKKAVEAAAAPAT